MHRRRSVRCPVGRASVRQFTCEHQCCQESFVLHCSATLEEQAKQECGRTTGILRRQSGCSYEALLLAPDPNSNLVPCAAVAGWSPHKTPFEKQVGRPSAAAAAGLRGLLDRPWWQRNGSC